MIIITIIIDNKDYFSVFMWVLAGSASSEGHVLWIFYVVGGPILLKIATHQAINNDSNIINQQV